MLKGNNQLHGKILEDMIKSTFYGSSDSKRNPTSIFDIESIFDKELNLNTSIKASKKNTVEMADARRFWNIKEEFRLLICKYAQVGKIKRFIEFHEIIITPKILNFLKGDLDLKIIEDFHNTLKTFQIGQHKEARKYAKEHNKILKNEYSSYIQLNPKIDTKNQRRLQCSINLLDISVHFPESYIIHNTSYKGLVFPIMIESETRKFNKGN